jgi:hypothetical protein
MMFVLRACVLQLNSLSLHIGEYICQQTVHLLVFPYVGKSECRNSPKFTRDPLWAGAVSSTVSCIGPY